MEGATEEGIKHFFRWRGAEGPKKMDGELRLASSMCRMCDVGHFAHTLPLCSLPRMDLWQKFPFRRPSRVSDSSESRVRVILFDTLRDHRLWRVSVNWSFTKYGYGACTEISRVYGYIPEKVTRETPLPKCSRWGLVQTYGMMMDGFRQFMVN